MNHARSLIGIILWLNLSLLAFSQSPFSKPEDIEFTAAIDGSQQRYVIMLPSDYDKSKAHSLLIALHGHGSDRWQFIHDPRPECVAARDAAAKHRMIYLSPDYRAKTSWMGPKAEADLVQIINDMRKEYQISKIILCGGSMGGTGAMTFAVLHSELLAGVVAMNGTANLVEYDKFQDAIAESFGGTKETNPVPYRERSAELHAEQLTMPIAFTTGGKDTIVPAVSVLRLADQLSKMNRPMKLIHRPDGGHDTSYEDAMSAFEFVLNAALNDKQ
jgi:pimeloyl-ACP methyl ester carboxylesterase